MQLVTIRLPSHSGGKCWLERYSMPPLGRVRCWYTCGGRECFCGNGR